MSPRLALLGLLAVLAAVGGGCATDPGSQSASFPDSCVPCTDSPTAAPVARIKVLPATVTIASNSTQQFAALATYADGSVHDLTQVVTWDVTRDPTAICSGGGHQA